MSPRKVPIHFLLVIVILMFTFLPWLRQPVLAAVTLVRFEIEEITEDSITLVWETATEFNNLGFIVYRSDSEDGIYEQISEFIVAEGTAVSGYVYQFSDDSIEAGMTYYYKLEAIDLDSNSEFYGPISNAEPEMPTLTMAASVTATSLSAAETATRTATSRPSSGATVTGTALRSATVTRTPTITLTATISPTITETSPFSFFTNTVTDTSTVTVTPSPTAEDLGEEELIATLTATEIEIKTSTKNPALITETPFVEAETPKAAPIKSFFIGFGAITLLGGLLVAGLVYYSKVRQRAG